MRGSKEKTMTTETLNEVKSVQPGPRRSWSRSKWLLAIPLAGVLAVSAAYAGNQGAGGGGPADGGGRHHGRAGEFGRFRMHHLLGAAGATDAQKAQIKAIFVGLRPQMQALRNERMKVRKQLTQALTAATVDTTSIEQLRRESVKLTDQHSALITQGLVKASQVLTPEQRQKVAAELGKH
jgi:periplasmic protein CpxP/Spy